MSFYQNPFGEEFRGNMPTGGERQMSLTFPIAANRTNGNIWEAFTAGPYDFSTYNTLTVNFAIDTNFRNYSAVSINLAGVTAGATTAQEVVDKLNANVTFSDYFQASIKTFHNGGRATPAVGSTSDAYGVATPHSVMIKSKRDKTRIRMYISNTGAEKIMRFNRYAGVAELPTYYDRHTVANRFNFVDGQAMLIKLDESDTIYDQKIITDAGLDFTAMKADWQLLAGRTVTFIFRKQTVDGSDRVTEVIEYPAGAKAGDLAMKATLTYTSTNKTPDTYAEIPYVLQPGDLITP